MPDVYALDKWVLTFCVWFTILVIFSTIGAFIGIFICKTISRLFKKTEE